VIRDAQVTQRVALALAVADFAVDGQCLLVVIDGAAVLPQRVIRVAQVAQRVAFAAAVSDFAGDG
jgi:hypothetical protein